MAPLWVIPYSDQEPGFWEEIGRRFGDHIRAVYFPLPGGNIASGRPPQPDRHLDGFLRQPYLSKSVLVNPIVLPRPVEEIAPVVIESLKELREEFDVSSVTVTSLLLARAIKEALPEFRVGASTLMGIWTPAQVLMVREYVDFIVPDNRLIRDLAGLRRFREVYPGEIRLIVNEACLSGCPHRVQHFYEMAYTDTIPQSLCRDMLATHPWLRMTGAWLLPRHLVHYEGLYDSLKIAGRVTLRDPEKYLRVLDAYINRKDILPCDIGGGPASLLAPIDIPDELFNRLLTCDKNCLSCNVCRTFYEQAVDRSARQ
jgi:hypothetical protein